MSGLWNVVGGLSPPAPTQPQASSTGRPKKEGTLWNLARLPRAWCVDGETKALRTDGRRYTVCEVQAEAGPKAG